MYKPQNIILLKNLFKKERKKKHSVVEVRKLVTVLESGVKFCEVSFFLAKYLFSSKSPQIGVCFLNR